MTWITFDLSIDEILDQVEMEELVNSLSEEDKEELSGLLNIPSAIEKEFVSLLNLLADYGVKDFLKELPYFVSKFDGDLSVLCEQQIKKGFI